MVDQSFLAIANLAFHRLKHMTAGEVTLKLGSSEVKLWGRRVSRRLSRKATETLFYQGLYGSEEPSMIERDIDSGFAILEG